MKINQQKGMKQKKLMQKIDEQQEVPQCGDTCIKDCTGLKI